MSLDEIREQLKTAVLEPCDPDECGAVNPMVRLLMERTDAGERITVKDLVDAGVASDKEEREVRHCVGGWLAVDGSHCPPIADTRVRISLVDEDGNREEMPNVEEEYERFIAGGYDDRIVVLTSPIIRWIEGDDDCWIQIELGGVGIDLLWDGEQTPRIQTFRRTPRDEENEYMNLAVTALNAAFWIRTIGAIVCREI